MNWLHPNMPKFLHMWSSCIGHAQPTGPWAQRVEGNTDTVKARLASLWYLASLWWRSLYNELHFDRSPFGQEGVPSDMASLWCLASLRCLAWPLCESHFDRTPLGLEGVSADLNTNTSNWWHFGKGKVLAISQSSAKLMHNLIWCTLMIWEQRPSHTKSSTEHRFPESLSTSFVSMSCQIPCPMHLLPCTNFLLANPCLFLQELCSPSLFFPQSTKTWFCL